MLQAPGWGHLSTLTKPFSLYGSFVGLQSKTSLTPLGDVADQDIPRGRGPVMAAADNGPQPAGAAGQQRSKPFALWGPAGGAGDLQRRPAACVLEECAPPPLLLAAACVAGLLPLCYGCPFSAGCCCASAAFCLRHAVGAHNDEHACAVDFIGNEHAPGLTPAAFRAALSRVHLERLPEHGAGSRVLTVRGVGFEARGPRRLGGSTHRPCAAPEAKSRACVRVLHGLQWCLGQRWLPAARSVCAYIQISKCQVGSRAPTANACFPACSRHVGVPAASVGSSEPLGR